MTEAEHDAHKKALSSWVDGWRPIATAPRDGTFILLGCATWERPELGQWSLPTAYWSTDGGSYEDGETASTSDEVDSPTYWQPLPPNPK